MSITQIHQQQQIQGLWQQNTGEIGTLVEYQGNRPEYAYNPHTDTYNDRQGSVYPANLNKSSIIKPKETNMVTEVAQDLKKFIKDHKSTIYVVAALLLVDHFMFAGAFKEKLKAIMNNLVGKVEAKLNETKV